VPLDSFRLAIRRAARGDRHALATTTGVAVLISSIVLPAAVVSRPSAAAADTTSAWTTSTVLTGSALHHHVPGVGTETLSQPDDLARLGDALFTIFQNDVGPDGTASPTGNLDSTIVEFTARGEVLGQWDLAGHGDGIAADPWRHVVVVTVNEDANASMYTIDPAGQGTGQVRHYSFDPNPLPHGGGTDAVSFFGRDLLVSASNPSVANGPAVYEADLDGTTAHLTEVFGDQSTATMANTPGSGGTTTLALTDPDSNAVVPGSSPRFAGQFELDSQGDEQQVFLPSADSPDHGLSVLGLDQSVNDSAWVTDAQGTLFVTQKGAGNVVAVDGPFHEGTVFVAVTPCNANGAPTTCPASGFPANYLGTENLFTGDVDPAAPTALGSLQPQGLLFVAL